MGIAEGADLLVGLQIAMEQHLLAIGTLDPKIVRRRRLLLAANQRLDLGPNEIGEPVHGLILPGWSAGDALAGVLPPDGGGGKA